MAGCVGISTSVQHHKLLCDGSDHNYLTKLHITTTSGLSGPQVMAHDVWMTLNSFALSQVITWIIMLISNTDRPGCVERSVDASAFGLPARALQQASCRRHPIACDSEDKYTAVTEV
jgi:hypothetical protein